MEIFAKVEGELFWVLGFNETLVFCKDRLFEGEEAGDIFNRSILSHKEEDAGIPSGNWRCRDKDCVSMSRDHVWKTDPGRKRNRDVVRECLDAFTGRGDHGVAIVHMQAGGGVNDF